MTTDPRSLPSKVADPLMLVGAIVALLIMKTGAIEQLGGDAEDVFTVGTIAAAVAALLRGWWEAYQARRLRNDATKGVSEVCAGLLEKVGRIMGEDRTGSELVAWIEQLPDPAGDDPSRHMLPDGTYTNRISEALAAWYAAAPEDVRKAAQAKAVADRLGQGG